MFEKYIKPGDVVVDVGANVGFLTLLACKLAGAQGHVFAYEPNPDVFRLLSKTITMNAFRQRSTLQQLAIFSASDELTLTWNPHQDGSGRIVTKAMSGLAGKHIKVAAEPLDKLLENKKIDFIKIDTEGAEPHVLFGAAKLIKNNSDIKIIMEWNPKHIKQRDGDVEQTRNFIFKHFNIVERINKVDDLSRLKPEDLGSIIHTNLLLRN
ncbi:MAG: FkbM family methyltransferase [Proteobacteria bacterium]|nr:FkbM family methyltransferase [Pseudomonadota bacterium]